MSFAAVEIVKKFAGNRLTAGTLKDRLSEKAAFFLLLIYLTTAPFPYGGVLAGGLFKLTAEGLLIAALVFFSKPELHRVRKAMLPILAAFAIAMLGLAQLVPLPSGILMRLSPTSAAVYRDASEVLALFGRQPPVPRISIVATETLTTLLFLVSLTAIFASSILLLESRLRRRIFIGSLLLTSVAQILFGAPALQSDKPRLSGPFVNPNHFAGYLAISAPFAIAIAWILIVKSRQMRIASSRGEQLGRLLPPLTGAAVLAGVLLTGIGLTRSRAGILAVVMTLMLFGFASLLHPRLRARRKRLIQAVLFVFVGTLIFIGMAAGTRPLLRFASTSVDIPTDFRTAIWRTSIEAWKQFPHAGSGLGTFREAFRRVQPREMAGLVEQAHNESLQLLVTGGWIGALLGIILFGSLFLQLWRLWKHQERQEESAMVLASLGALFCLTLHGLVEFNFSVPAIPATLAAVLGLGFAAGDPSDGAETDDR